MFQVVSVAYRCAPLKSLAPSVPLGNTLLKPFLLHAGQTQLSASPCTTFCCLRSCSYSSAWSRLPLLHGHTAVLCPMCGPPALPSPFLPTCCLSAWLLPALLRGVVPSQVQDFVFVFVEFPEVFLSSLIQLVKLPLNSGGSALQQSITLPISVSSADLQRIDKHRKYFMGQSACRPSEQAMLEVFSAQDAMAAVTHSPLGSQLRGQPLSTWQRRVCWCKLSCCLQTVFLGACHVSDSQKCRTEVTECPGYVSYSTRRIYCCNNVI